MVNILDRSDRSRQPVFGGAVSVPKRSKNDWSQGGQPGRFCMINKNELNIDGRYQRSQVSDNKVREIARKWDYVLLGVILVVKRQDGTLWVFDGGHRTRASFYRDDIETLPCMVYDMDSISSEAKAFLGKNLMITNVSSVDKYKAAVVADDPTARKAERLLLEHGIEVSACATKSTQLKCISTLQTLLDRDEELARRCFGFCLLLSNGAPVSSAVLRGLFTLCQRMSDRCDILIRYRERLTRHSQREIEVRIRQMRAECGNGGDKVEALALLSLINKGCKNKLAW